MVRILIALLLGLGALTYSLQPVLAGPGQATILQDNKKRTPARKRRRSLSKPPSFGKTGYKVENCSAAAENILLAAHALGLGAVWTAGYPAEERIAPIAAALGLPSNVKPLCIIPVGVPAENPEPKDKWKPENIHWEQW